MRLIITLITSLILLLPASGQGQWKFVDIGIDFIPGIAIRDTDSIPDRDIGSRTPFNEVQFIDRDIGFIATGNCGVHQFPWGALIKTKDGGKTWNLIYNATDHDYSHFLFFLNEVKGFSAGGGSNCFSTRLYTSSDSGYSWNRAKMEKVDGYGFLKDISFVSDIFFLNDSLGWTYGDGTLFKTIDGGDNWSEESKNELAPSITSLFFIDEESGWAVGSRGLILKYNSNDDWIRIPEVTDLPLNKVFFIDRNNGWISGGYNKYGEFRPYFIRTFDGGEIFEKISNLNYLINDFYFENKDHGWAVGEFEVYREERGVILETFNGGSEWEVVVDSLPVRLNALHIKDGIGWAVGDDGLVLKCDSIVTGVEEDKKINSSNESLLQNYPNPFSSNTTITYQLLASSNVELSIYDISGRKAATLVNELQPADKYEIEWNTEGMNPGIYLCELKTGRGRQVIKMFLIR